MRRGRQRQRGVAVITALLLTTLAVTIVASLFWQQQVQVRSMENQRLHLQTKWILRGALDFTTLVLRQDGFDHPTYTALDHVWATTVAETPLDQYIERERVEGEVFNATVSGRIVDATSRYNLRNLANNRQPDTNQIAIYRRLLQNLQLDQTLADRTASAIANAQPVAAPPPPGASPAPTPQAQTGSEPIELTQLDDLLAIPGYTVEVVGKLRDHAIVLPEQTKVNVNTAGAEVLAAVMDNMSVSDANAIIVRRKQAHFRTEAEFLSAANGKLPVQGAVDVKSEYFLVLSRVRLDRAALDAEALIYRKLDPAKTTELRWIRQN
jgi:general secretion pathway protein K